jgi:diguanylate cyclase (GGDEF)-like protein
MVFQSLYSAMRKGWDKKEITEVVERLNGTLPDMKIRVFRGQIVAQQFGEMPGEHPVIQQDRELQAALNSGTEMLLFPNESSIRYLYPVLATQECLVCHTQSHLGAVHGVIDITYPVANLKVSFGTVINTIIIYTLLILAVVFLAMYIKLRYLVAMPIARLTEMMRHITEGMDLSHRIGKGNWIAELHHLGDYFNRLLDTIQEYNAKLEEVAIRDPLTGLYNRRKFQEMLDGEIQRAARHSRTFSMVMIDLDNFKYINDTFGHPIGDLTLRELTAMMQSSLRRGDVLARLGGDEFALMLPETSAMNALQVVNKLHSVLSDKDFELPIGKIRVTASFGMVSYPEDGATAGALLTAMDVLLYKAKKLGKNQVVTADAAGETPMMDIFRQGEFLRLALREERVLAFLQPIVNVRSGAVAAFEVLARIRDGERIMLAGDFIEVAEELGMAKELDRAVFMQGLMHYQKVSLEHVGVKMFFNLSAASFGDLEWVRGIPAILSKLSIPCDRVVLEITEREALPNLNQVKTVIDELRRSGLCFALDDFGSGFSSFLYLKYLEVDYVKIEGSFVRQIVADKRDRIMVEHIHSMASQFGLKTVAEFVEDEATNQMLMEIGVDFAQGYHYGKAGEVL